MRLPKASRGEGRDGERRRPTATVGRSDGASSRLGWPGAPPVLASGPPSPAPTCHNTRSLPRPRTMAHYASLASPRSSLGPAPCAASVDSIHWLSLCVSESLAGALLATSSCARQAQGRGSVATRAPRRETDGALLTLIPPPTSLGGVPQRQPPFTPSVSAARGIAASFSDISMELRAGSGKARCGVRRLISSAPCPSLPSIPSLAPCLAALAQLPRQSLAL